MKKTGSLYFYSVSLFLLAIILVGCSGSSGSTTQTDANGEVMSKLTKEQATEMAENALQAYNSGNYAAYTRDWTDTMKSTFNDKGFQSTRDQFMRDYGKFVSISSAEKKAAQTAGYVRWEFLADFEKVKIRFALVFKQDDTKVEGAHIEPVK